MLTRRHGKVRAVGKGVRRTSSRFGARLEPGSHIDVQLHSRHSDGSQAPLGGRTLDIVTQTESLGAYGASLAGDYSRWTAASAICETTDKLTDEGEPALDGCAKCSAPGPHAAFNVAAGGVVCDGCRPPGSTRPDRETIALMSALLSGDWARADASLAGPRREASGLIAAHLQWHLERQLRSLPLVDRAF